MILTQDLAQDNNKINASLGRSFYVKYTNLQVYCCCFLVTGAAWVQSLNLLTQRDSITLESLFSVFGLRFWAFEMSAMTSRLRLHVEKNNSKCMFKPSPTIQSNTLPAQVVSADSTLR
jgi:hypothetical protein